MIVNWIWQTWILHSSVMISLLSSSSATELVVRVSSEGVVYHFEYLRVIQPCMMSGTVCSLFALCIHSLKSKKLQSYSHPNVHAIFKYLDIGLKAAMWWAPAVWYRVPLFTPGNKNEMHNFMDKLLPPRSPPCPRSSRGLIYLLLFGANGRISS